MSEVKRFYVEAVKRTGQKEKDEALFGLEEKVSQELRQPMYSGIKQA